MPSGSHGGSSGSHSSGGSSFGGGGISFGGGPSRPSRPPHPVRMPFRRHGVFVYVQSNKLTQFFSLISFGLFFGLLSLLIIFAGGSSQKNYIKKIETDYAYYQDMIAYAEEHTEYIKIGKVTDKFANEDNDDYWYITYSLKTTDNKTLEGYSYSVYTFDQIKNFHVGDPVELAVNNPEVDLNTDSIPMDYKDKALTDDGEYLNAKNSLRTLYVVGGVMATISVTLVVVGFVVLSKNMSLETNNSKGNAEPKEIKAPTPSSSTCPYCGSKNKIDAERCKSCGGSLKQ